jgi:hypothetical protein
LSGGGESAGGAGQTLIGALGPGRRVVGEYLSNWAAPGGCCFWVLGKLTRFPTSALSTGTAGNLRRPPRIERLGTSTRESVAIALLPAALPNCIRGR